ncbi:hypothetical protein, partial [Pseudomonas aeruginosa]|uniref:hypothetical protein n=1 Tax=Pseudomonas aeruginosa TaxID=287 RepID=UPI001ABC08A8
MQITSDIELSGAGCTTAITPNQLVQSSSENDTAPVALAGLSQTYVFKKKETACPAVRSSPPPSAKACWR